MKKLSSISVFFPSLNDSKILPYLIYKTFEVLPHIADRYEVIIINDGSTDDTKEVLTAMQKFYKKLRVVHHRKNKGYGGALIAGFTNATKDWIFYTDGDGQYDVSELPLLVKKVTNNTDVINGFKLNRVDNIIRKIVGTAYNSFLHQVHTVPISDVDCDFRLIKKTAIKKIELESQSGMICLELVLKLHRSGARFKEVGVHHYPRRFGKSQFFNPKHIVTTFIEHLKFLHKTRLSTSRLFRANNY